MWLIAILIALVAHTEPELKELVPGIFVSAGIVEFEGSIAIDCHHEGTPDVFLEMFITAPDSREHESLIVSKIRGSNLHAALLAAGFEPGQPMSIDSEFQQRTPAQGDKLRIEVLIDDNPPIAIESWVVSVDTQQPLPDSSSWTTFVFAGSKFLDNAYAADTDGTLAALTSFTTEVIAPAWTLFHDAAADEPIWIANRDLVPQQGTKLRVRITAAPDEISE
jgi:hypothetical protein